MCCVGVAFDNLHHVLRIVTNFALHYIITKKNSERIIINIFYNYTKALQQEI